MSASMLVTNIESILSIVEDGEYISADSAMVELRKQVDVTSPLGTLLKKSHDAIQHGTYIEMITFLEMSLDFARKDAKM